MATITSTLYSQFIGSPVTVTVQAGNVANATFQRVRIAVKVNDTTSFEFSTPVSAGGQQVVFDIASAFCAFVDNFQYAATGLNTYPNLYATVTAYDDYMVDGTEYSGITQDGNTATISGLYAGALTDLERITSTRPARYSRKPTSSPEMVFEGYKLLVPSVTTSDVAPLAPSVSEVAVALGANATYNYYGIEKPADGYEIRFINSLGVHENIFVTCLPTIEVPITTEEYTIARQETLSQFSRGTTTKQGNHERWRMSSGPLDRKWASWYIHEFLMARWVWLGINSQLSTLNSQLTYIPCHVLPEETTTLINRKEALPLEVQFTLKLDIKGSPLV